MFWCVPARSEATNVHPQRSAAYRVESPGETELWPHNTTRRYKGTSRRLAWPVSPRPASTRRTNGTSEYLCCYTRYSDRTEKTNVPGTPELSARIWSLWNTVCMLFALCMLFMLCLLFASYSVRLRCLRQTYRKQKLVIGKTEIFILNPNRDSYYLYALNMKKAN